ncbi:MAG TPA: NAD(P)-binding domain-containing protein [Candidatus Limnocylindrales bacterium]|nr:NAD(P)-binding domain-containing protein [Candidatus Limnocylindrales bacterium]
MTSLPRTIDTVVVGAGQAGLTMSRHLQRAGRDHVVLERRATLGGGWQDRWDGFRLVGPNWTASFPDAPYDGPDPDGFMPRDEIVGRIAGYARSIDAPVVLEASVERLRPDGSGGGFVLDTGHGPVAARQVVVATGGFHVPHVPAVAAGLSPRVTSLHAHDYRRPGDLPPGGVLVVGSGQTGVQLVEELVAAGREVFIAVGATGRVPRRYRGRDIFFWLSQLAERGEALGVALPTVDQLPHPSRRLAGNPALSGHGGGHETNVRAYGRDGATLLGRVDAIAGERVRFAPGLRANLAMADRFFEERFREAVDEFITAAGIDASPAEPPVTVDFEPAEVEELDLARSGIGTVLWTTGYRQSLGWIEPPITDELGFARQVRGVSNVPGLFFIGSLWQHDQTSATLVGLRRDAKFLAERMGLATAGDG